MMVVPPPLSYNLGQAKLMRLGQVFHEENFRQRYKELMISAYISSQDNTNYIWIALLVLGLGAHYSSLATAQSHEQTRIQQFSKDIITQVKQQFLRIISSVDKEAVQIYVLLGSFLLFNSRPTTGLRILGSGIKIAQILRLHHETALTGISASYSESYRRSW